MGRTGTRAVPAPPESYPVARHLVPPSVPMALTQRVERGAVRRDQGDVARAGGGSCEALQYRIPARTKKKTKKNAISDQPNGGLPRRPPPSLFRTPLPPAATTGPPPRLPALLMVAHGEGTYRSRACLAGRTRHRRRFCHCRAGPGARPSGRSGGHQGADRGRRGAGRGTGGGGGHASFVRSDARAPRPQRRATGAARPPRCSVTCCPRGGRCVHVRGPLRELPPSPRPPRGAQATTFPSQLSTMRMGAPD